MRLFSSLTKYFLPEVIWVSSKRCDLLCFINKETCNAVADLYLEKAAQWFCQIGQGEALVLVLTSILSSEICEQEVCFKEYSRMESSYLNPKEWNTPITNTFTEDKLEVAHALQACLESRCRVIRNESHFWAAPRGSVRTLIKIRIQLLFFPFSQKAPLWYPYEKTYHAFWQLRKQTQRS